MALLRLFRDAAPVIPSVLQSVHAVASFNIHQTNETAMIESHKHHKGIIPAPHPPAVIIEACCDVYGSTKCEMMVINFCVIEKAVGMHSVLSTHNNACLSSEASILFVVAGCSSTSIDRSSGWLASCV